MTRVIARKGVRVPLENDSRRYITDSQAVEVVLTTYYRRRLSDGDLELVPAKVAEPAAKAVAPAATKTADTGAKKED
ncbi:hypothetical protein NG99_04595 [Erwinia typographi]|uniref:DUF2635 domain-containing protein n=1 Tax=Erwinia typographi TaxID=371042 RepID=A0A0A3Z885_9GAMM|nr:DUF2635 domain-containing protein [Erwinia typographi]KGT95302.1 hypothetical protein NG99_04595 [Erwinia typographi]